MKRISPTPAVRKVVTNPTESLRGLKIMEAMMQTPYASTGGEVLKAIELHLEDIRDAQNILTEGLFTQEDAVSVITRMNALIDESTELVRRLCNRLKTQFH